MISLNKFLAKASKVSNNTSAFCLLQLLQQTKNGEAEKYLQGHYIISTTSGIHYTPRLYKFTPE